MENFCEYSFLNNFRNKKIANIRGCWARIFNGTKLKK